MLTTLPLNSTCRGILFSLHSIGRMSATLEPQDPSISTVVAPLEEAGPLPIGATPNTVPVAHGPAVPVTPAPLLVFLQVNQNPNPTIAVLGQGS